MGWENICVQIMQAMQIITWKGVQIIQILSISARKLVQMMQIRKNKTLPYLVCVIAK